MIPSTHLHSTIIIHTLNRILVSASEPLVLDTSVSQFCDHYPTTPISISVALSSPGGRHHRLARPIIDLTYPRHNSAQDLLCSLLRMCWYKRVIFADNHAKPAGLVRKCHLQLAYENGETTSGCGKVDFHLVQSIRVQEVCPDCAARLGKQANMLATIKEQISQAKTKLRLSTDTKSDAVVDEPDVHDADEAFSPVSISFLS